MRDAKELVSLLEYHPGVGFTWVKPRQHRIKAGSPAGSTDKLGYRWIKFRGRLYGVHQLVFFLEKGRWPKGFVDHANGKPGDNRIENLRECTNRQNKQNIGIMRTNTTGFPGVSFHRTCGRYIARIRNHSRLIHLGYFDTAEAAYQKYREAKRQLHEFAPDGRDLPAMLEG